MNTLSAKSIGVMSKEHTKINPAQNLKKIFAANTTTRKCQLHQELNNIQYKDISMSSYTLKIKEMCNSLEPINVDIDDDETVQICLDSLTPRFDAIMSIVLAIP